MTRPWHSVGVKLAIICAGLVMASTALLAVIFYLGTIGVLARDRDAKVTAIGQRLAADAECAPLQATATRIALALRDGVDSDTEIYLLLAPDGRFLAGNISPWPAMGEHLDQLLDRSVVRAGRDAAGRVLLHRLSDGALLLVGRDQNDLNEIRGLTARAILVGGCVSLALAIVGAFLFWRQIERRISAIRHTASDIEAGNLSRRIPLSGGSDEFSRLAGDINRMLDRIEHLMDGVRHVSNTIAHNIRTPLARIRGRMEQALAGRGGDGALCAAGTVTIEEIDQLTGVLDKLLQIAEAESGTRRQPFQPVPLRPVVTNLLELYDAAAEARGMRLLAHVQGEPVVMGDKDLLACILANLLDNSMKYAGQDAVVTVRAGIGAGGVGLLVEDNGPGIPDDEIDNVLGRFYRVDRRPQGHGLGLSIVSALTQAHGGRVTLENARPGLRVCIHLPLLQNTAMAVSF